MIINHPFHTKKVNKRFYRRKQINKLISVMDEQIKNADENNKVIYKAVRLYLVKLKLLREKTSPRYLITNTITDGGYIFMQFGQFLNDLTALNIKHNAHPLILDFIDYARMSLMQRENTLIAKHWLSKNDADKFDLQLRFQNARNAIVDNNTLTQQNHI